jgi:hypothetical protein
MKEEQGHFDVDERRLVFGARTVLIPGRKVEIGFSVRKKSAFPLVQEHVLKLLKTVGGASLELLIQFFDFSEKEVRDVIMPLLEKGYIIQREGEYRLSDVGLHLFTSSDDGAPAISESESLKNTFLVDDHCGLPVLVSNIGPHVRIGNLKWFIEELHVDSGENQLPNEKTTRSFNEYFQNFISNQGDLEKIRFEKMMLHKTDYVKTKDSLLIRADIQCFFENRAIADNHVIPFDDLLPKSDSRQKLRGELISCVTTPATIDPNGEIEFLRGLFGNDFLDGCAKQGVVAWFTLVPKLFSSDWPVMGSGARLIVGDVCLSRNISQIISLFENLISEREVTTETPLKIVWVRPAVKSWGRSIGFLESISALREAAHGFAKGEVEIELWEQSGRFEEKGFPQQRSYEKWFDKLKRFSSSRIPPKVEMLLVGDAGGIVLTHAYTPAKSCFPCPLGIFFEENDTFQELMKSEVHGGLRSLPRLAKKKKNKTKGNTRH